MDDDEPGPWTRGTPPPWVTKFDDPDRFTFTKAQDILVPLIVILAPFAFLLLWP